jgi:ribosomal protein L11 methyltransferase
VPYRIDLADAAPDALDRLVELGALDVESLPAGGIAALLPDRVTPGQVGNVLGTEKIAVTPAAGRDADSVWILSQRPIQVGPVRIVPAGGIFEPDAVRLLDAPAFGTGRHPTTALCLEALDEAVNALRPDSMLDVGTGSGILALAAVRLGVPRALGIDLDPEALRVAAENARINAAGDRVALAHGGPDALERAFPLVVANVLAGPLIEMAPVLVRRIGHYGRLILSGIPRSAEADVDLAYRRLGMRTVEVKTRAGWVALVLHASW